MSQIGHTVLGKLCNGLIKAVFALESNGISTGIKWNSIRIPLESSGIPLESSGIPLESNGISTESSRISTDPVEFPLESSGNSTGITLFQWKKVPFIPLEFQ